MTPTKNNSQSYNSNASVHTSVNFSYQKYTHPGSNNNSSNTSLSNIQKNVSSHSPLTYNGQGSNFLQSANSNMMSKPLSSISSNESAPIANFKGFFTAGNEESYKKSPPSTDYANSSIKNCAIRPTLTLTNNP